MRKVKTNEELVIDLMNYSPFGGLCQGFIMEAIQDYASRVIAAPNIADNDFISGATWKGLAVDVKERCDAFYGRNKQGEQA